MPSAPALVELRLVELELHHLAVAASASRSRCGCRGPTAPRSCRCRSAPGCRTPARSCRRAGTSRPASAAANGKVSRTRVALAAHLDHDRRGRHRPACAGSVRGCAPASSAGGAGFGAAGSAAFAAAVMAATALGGGAGWRARRPATSAGFAARRASALRPACAAGGRGAAGFAAAGAARLRPAWRRRGGVSRSPAARRGCGALLRPAPRPPRGRAACRPRLGARPERLDVDDVIVVLAERAHVDLADELETAPARFPGRDCASIARSSAAASACTSARSKRSGASNVNVSLSSLRSVETAISAGRPKV